MFHTISISHWFIHGDISMNRDARSGSLARALERLAGHWVERSGFEDAAGVIVLLRSWAVRHLTRPV